MARVCFLEALLPQEEITAIEVCVGYLDIVGSYGVALVEALLSGGAYSSNPSKPFSWL